MLPAFNKKYQFTVVLGQGGGGGGGGAVASQVPTADGWQSMRLKTYSRMLPYFPQLIDPIPYFSEATHPALLLQCSVVPYFFASVFGHTGNRLYTGYPVHHKLSHSQHRIAKNNTFNSKL